MNMQGGGISDQLTMSKDAKVKWSGKMGWWGDAEMKPGEERPFYLKGVCSHLYKPLGAWTGFMQENDMIKPETWISLAAGRAADLKGEGPGTEFS